MTASPPWTRWRRRPPRTPGLTYDPTSDVYTYVWKTQKSWGDTCGTLLLMLADGTVHTALFNFR